MSAKKVRVEFLDASGQGVGGVNVKVNNGNELQTTPMGQALFLVEDESFTIFANGAEVAKDSLANVPEKYIFKQDGGSWKLA